MNEKQSPLGLLADIVIGIMIGLVMVAKTIVGGIVKCVELAIRAVTG